jgi:lipopolysaccharide transport system ATP-binding protein
MTSTAIEVRSISKRYSLGENGLRGLFAPKSRRSEFWALKDVTFDILENQAVGIIGSNGAGKSTLLKILSRVTAPTAGRARLHGRIGTILEVGTGFHPELTGRENIYLSGTILGMGRGEIDRRLEAIVEFAGVNKFIDTPVKRYSSGMYVRLAFAVAAHLEPDILIVDEVLAVGDVGFQKKCLAKMDDSVHREGRTIVFVSHNVQAIRALCSRAILLDAGKLVADGPVSDVLARYSAEQSTLIDTRGKSLKNRLNRTRGRVRITSCELGSRGGSWSFVAGEAMDLKIDYEVYEPIESLAALVVFASAGDGTVITNIKEVVHRGWMSVGVKGSITISIPKIPFRPGEFALSLGLGNDDFSVFEDILDTNVDIPHVTIESDEQDLFLRSGLFSVDYRVTYSSEPPTMVA